MANSADPNLMSHSAVSDLGLHHLLRPVCPNIWNYIGILPVVVADTGCLGGLGGLCKKSGIRPLGIIAL